MVNEDSHPTDLSVSGGEEGQSLILLAHCIFFVLIEEKVFS